MTLLAARRFRRRYHVFAGSNSLHTESQSLGSANLRLSLVISRFQIVRALEPRWFGYRIGGAR